MLVPKKREKKKEKRNKKKFIDFGEHFVTVWVHILNESDMQWKKKKKKNVSDMWKKKKEKVKITQQHILKNTPTTYIRCFGSKKNREKEEEKRKEIHRPWTFCDGLGAYFKCKWHVKKNSKESEKVVVQKTNEWPIHKKHMLVPNLAKKKKKKKNIIPHQGSTKKHPQKQ